MRQINNNYAERILLIVEEAEQPIDAENVRIKAGIANWQTCLKHLLELVVAKKIMGEKTTKSWIFWSLKKNE